MAQDILALEHVVVSRQRSFVAARICVYAPIQSQTARCLLDRLRRFLTIMKILSLSVLAHGTLQPLSKMLQMVKGIYGMLNTAIYRSEHTCTAHQSVQPQIAT